MGVPLFRFRLTHQVPEGVIQFTNNSFDVSITGWDQVIGASEQLFVWNNPSSARSDGSVSNFANTAAIGQASPFDSANGWHPGRYTIEIRATNNSAGGSAPLQSRVGVYASQFSNSIGTSITYVGTGHWVVGDPTKSNRITFELDTYYKYLWFKFEKDGADAGYEVLFTIDYFNIITAPNVHYISEPDGWKDAILKLERHPDFHSLVEYFDGSFIFYGSDGIIDGGLDFIKNIELIYGFDATIGIYIEVSFNDGGSYEEVFSGQLDLSELQEVKDNKIDVPIIRDDLWAKFISRLDTPVNLSSTTDLDGNPVLAVEPIDISLTGQKVRQKYNGLQDQSITISYNIPDNQWGGIDFGQETLSEIEEKFTIVRLVHSTRPNELFAVKYAGAYNFSIQIYTTTAVLLGSATDSNLDVRLQINDGTAITLTKTNEGTGGLDGRTKHTYSGTQTLNKGDFIRLYFFNNNAAGASYTFDWPANVFYESFLTITADTEFPSSDAKGYYLHDIFAGIIERIVGRNMFYSEILGRTDTNMRAYNSNGCFSPFALMKGLQLRGYAITEKPFFISFNQAWKGADPIFNLGLGYETVSGEEVIRIEDKASFYDKNNISVYFDNVRDIIREYDTERMFKTITIGYNKGMDEKVSGLDDPLKQTRTTRIKKKVTDISLLSDFIHASIPIETTRRLTLEKNADHKFDNETFIIHLNESTLSPDRYQPATTEDFDSVTGLLNASTRYNIILSPLRNFLRWANYFGGCLQKYLTSSYKFVSGEGNYDMVSDYSFALGNSCLGKIADALTESQDIALGPPNNYNTALGFIHLPDFLQIEEIDLVWEDYKTIRDNRKYSVAISQTSSNHKKFLIKNLAYKICFSKCDISQWAGEQFQILVPDSQQQMIECPRPETLNLRLTETDDIRIIETGEFRIVE